jgi:regulator of cell morphogenesis and NO signaling
MYLNSYHINPSSFVTDIVTHDYRTADVFRKYDIDFCCGGKWPLEEACSSRGLNIENVVEELEKVIHIPAPKASIDFNEWDIDFLSDYILNVHHRYLKKALPSAKGHVAHFLEGHKSKFPELAELELIIRRLMKEIPPHMQQEEEIIFPYIRQIHRAYYNGQSYARLLVKTLRKPVEEVMMSEHQSVVKNLQRMRELTNNYTSPANACLTHKVTFSKLKEMDTDLIEHIHLETNILFPKAIAMEKELLAEI